MYKLLIVEDEKIERESLQFIIQGFDLSIDHVITAENGEQGLLKYYEEQPDIILTDIDMPLLGGLDMIEKIRKTDAEIMCLVLTSYDYFSYAQRAIRLNVEDFVLKPTDKESLRKSLTQAIETLTRDKNTYNQTSSLVQKINEMKALLESECFYAVLTKRNEFKLLETFKLAGLAAASCCCIIFKEKKELSHHLAKLRGEIEDMGYMCIQGTIHHQFVFFILSNRDMSEADKMLFLKTLGQSSLSNYEWALGSVQNEIANFYGSYEDAHYNLNNSSGMHPTHLESALKKDQLIEMSKEWVEGIMDHIDGDLQSLIHGLCQEFLHYGHEDINKIMEHMIKHLVKESNMRYQLAIEINDTMFEEVHYGNHQNLEIVVTQLLNKIIKPIKSMKYQNNSSLIKKSMTFIEQNYAKPISLNTLADELKVSPFYISKLFGKELGHNFTDVVNDIRIKHAKKLIRKDFPFKEVAYEVGFGSQSYFTKMFKKVVGMSPTDYRKLFP